MDNNRILVKMVLDRWFASMNRFTELLSSLSDEQLQREVAPGKNRGIYLLGHLIAVHDDMLTILNFGDRKYSTFQKLFIHSPDKTQSDIPSVSELRTIWNEQKEELNKWLESLRAEEWFERHTAVNAEDFDKEPHRNKLNIVLTRTTHLNYHTGQMILLK